jgi:hypothetical protein
MQATCSYCGKTIGKSPATLKTYKHAFCDRKCYSKWKKEVWVYPVRSKKHSFWYQLKKRFGGRLNENQKSKKFQGKKFRRPIGTSS